MSISDVVTLIILKKKYKLDILVKADIFRKLLVLSRNIN